jgi:hypothetical protein
LTVAQPEPEYKGKVQSADESKSVPALPNLAVLKYASMQRGSQTNMQG